ncbi:UNVERIFIED_CONTAM: hypothetical protein Slati_0196400 [Sesamum latifolium]|uniref:Reverse transcriptase zinc-binding domain-containing protein n=1 Tax=Sesamum latifolium TaxID=2727402 RepID=A0AAW2YBJ2_9LAMI
MKELEARCVTLEQGVLCRETRAELQQVRQQLEELHARETLKWQQRSKNHWLRDGDDNIRFFHAQALARRRQNSISGLRDDIGNWRDKEEDIQHLLSQYFRLEMNQALAQPFTADEVEKATFAFELNHHLKLSNRAKDSNVAIKLDMSKADCGGGGGPSSTTVSHLLFADDTLVFCEAKVGQLEEIRRILDGYARASGQLVMRSTWGYCGWWAVARGDVSWALRAGMERVHGWNGKLLSQAGKEVLIKAVIQSLPTYVMSYFSIAGGWRLLCRPEALLSRVLKARYFTQGSFWSAPVGSRPSLTWRSILSARNLLQEGCRWEEENGGTWVWQLGKGGRFIVRTAYRQAMHIKERNVASSSGGGGYECAVVTIMVNAHPPRVRLFMWRVCKGAVPMLVNLAKRREGIETVCAVWGGRRDHQAYIVRMFVCKASVGIVQYPLANGIAMESGSSRMVFTFISVGSNG